MGRASSKRRRQRTIQLLEQVTQDHELATHMHDKQIAPQNAVDEMRAEGKDVDVAFVNTSPDAAGFLIHCVECGRSARTPVAPPTDAVVLCPECVQLHRRRGRGW